MATVREELARAIPRLERAGVDTPRLDAEVLLAHVLGRDRAWLWAHPEQALRGEDVDAFGHALRRREQREPLAYILGEWEFYGRAFRVSLHVLVPRPETELLVDEVLAWSKGRDVRRLADVGTGSGAIGVTLAAERVSLDVYAVDLSPEALQIARENATRHGVAARIRFLQGDLLSPLHEAGVGVLDAIVANLPYIAEEECEGLMPEVRDYEPRLALAGGPGGLVLVRRLIDEAPALLNRGGLLALELGQGQAQEVAQTLAGLGWDGVRVVCDYAGIERHVLAERR